MRQGHEHTHEKKRGEGEEKEQGWTDGTSLDQLKHFASLT
jgi:hypothetical protein